MRRERRNLIRHFIAFAAIAAGFLAATAWLVNRPETLKHALAIANVRSGWNIDIARFHWDPLTSRIELGQISIEQRSTGKKASADGALARYKLLGFLRGKFVIDTIELDNARIALPPRDPAVPKKPHQRINLARLLLLKNIEILDGKVNGLFLSFGNGFMFATDEMDFALVPSIFGENRLALRSNGAYLKKGEKDIISAGLVSLRTATALDRWGVDFPYLNAFTGNLRIQDATAYGMTADRIDAKVSYNDDVLNLSDLTIDIEGRKLIGRLDLDVGNEGFDLSIDIPNPIAVPYFGRKLETLDTEGEISGSVRLQGKGFMPRESDGAGHVELTHRFDVARQAPISVVTDATWKNGVITLFNAAVLAGMEGFPFNGEIDIPGKRMALEAKGSRFPIENIFDKFTNKHLRKIFGPTDFEGTFEGWGKNFKAHVLGTTYNGGWRPIAVSRVETELTATYDDLMLKGKIFTAGRDSGSADLKIKYGPKIPGQIRSKLIDLTAEVHNADLAEALGSMGLAGSGTGNIVLKGPQTSFEGKVLASIDNGSWHGVPFDSLSSNLGITRRKLTFDNIEIGLPGLAVQKATGPLIADIAEGSMRLHGEPFTGFSMDATYRYDGSRWSFAGIRWKDPQREGSELVASGSLSSGGPMDLKIRGQTDARVLPMLLSSVRDAQGILDIDISARGASADPRISGAIKLSDNSLRLKNPRISLNALNGSIRFDGPRVFFDDITAETEDGTLKIDGRIDQKNFKPVSADLAISGSDMRYRTEDRTLNLELEGDLKLVGAFPSPILSGSIRILDGRYSKDFNIIDVIAGGKAPKPLPEKGAAFEFNPRLDLTIRNTGDLAIRNNVGDIWLNSNIELKGTRDKPSVIGSIDVVDGQVHYMGVNFDITKGFMEFRGERESPYLEVQAQKEIDTYNVNMTLHGPTDNLMLDLSATSPQGPLEKRDVISLILFGATEQERLAAERSGSSLTASMAASSVSGLIERPISRFAHLDVFRLEASEPSSHAISRINIGKQVSDRLTFKFATDINKYNAVQTFAAEYQITDNTLLRGSRSTDASYEISGLLRFRLK